MAKSSAKKESPAPDKAPETPAPSPYLGEFEATNPPWMIGDRKVAKIAVAKLSFVQTVAAMDAASMASRMGEGEYKKSHLRERRKLQVKAFDASGTPIAIDDLAMLGMPSQYAMKVQGLLFSNSEPEGEVISRGDGTTGPILYKLGTPLKMMGVEIPELEFVAATLGDIEDVLAADGLYSQALALVKRCAKPIVVSKSGEDAPALTALPDSTINQLTTGDGFTIAEKVLKHFL